MNRFIHCNLLFIVLLLISTCQTANKNETAAELNIDLNEAKPTINLNDIASDLNFVRLQTQPGFLIGNIRNIIIEKNIYVQNFRNIFVFDIHGNPLYKIDAAGRSEGTYYEINDFRVDDSGNLEIWDRVKKQMLYFDSTGEYQFKRKFNVIANYYTKLDSIYYFYNSGAYTKKGAEAYLVSTFGFEGKKRNDYLPVNHLGMNSFSTPYLIGQHNKMVYFEEAPLSKIYALDGNKLFPLYRINICNKTLSKEEYLQMRDMRASDRFHKITNQSYHSRGITAIGDYGIKMTLVGKRKVYICFYNLDDHRYQLGEQVLENHYFNTPIRRNLIYKNRYIGYIPAHEIIDHVNIKAFIEEEPKTYSVLRNLERGDNPILITGHLKR